MKHLIRLAAAIVSLGHGHGHVDESAKPRPLVTFGLVTDVQYADAEPHLPTVSVGE